MKLLALCGLLFLCLLCLNVFAVEGQKGRKLCCSKGPKLRKRTDKGINSKKPASERRKYCKPCLQQFHPVISGPLPQLK